MEGYCRGCLVKYDPLTDLIQYTEKNRRLYVYCTGIQVKRNDAFPFQLCKDCYSKMKIACAFRKMCRTSDKSIRNYQTLKETGDVVDFGSFVKNNDSLAFRFPLANGNSTPAFHRSKDDDNESTCTSIRNFMTDILRSEELPDTEVQIIRQVIEEEADVLDDSLDSHWLQDDASIDTDFRLDLSFSPFSTPRRIFNDHCYTPRKVDDSSQPETIVPDITKLLELPEKTEVIEPERTAPEIDFQIGTEPENYGGRGRELPNFYVETIEAVDEVDETVNRLAARDVIDRNLDRALRNADKQEICLGDLLDTPPGGSAVSTPTIHNILFGDKDDSGQLNLSQYIGKYENLEDDDIDTNDFYQYNDPLGNDDVDEKQSTVSEQNMADNYDLTDFSCKLCNNKKFKHARALNIHFFRTHKVSIKSTSKKKSKPKKPVICQFCGKNVYDRGNLQRHIKAIHMKSDVVPKCDRCGQTFAFESKLRMHMKTHIGAPTERPKKKENTCIICGVSFSSKYGLRTHCQRSHEKAVTVICHYCNKGFVRKADLVVHLRVHNKDRPYPCLYCDKRFARRDTLSRHIKCHLDENCAQCCYCEKKFKNLHSLRKHIEISETCLRFRLERKLKEEDKDPTMKKKNSNKTRFFVIRPKTKVKQPNVSTDTEAIANHVGVPTEVVQVPTEVVQVPTEVVQVPTEVTSAIELQSAEISATATPKSIDLNENVEGDLGESGPNDMIQDGISFVKENVPSALLSLPLLI